MENEISLRLGLPPDMAQEVASHVVSLKSAAELQDYLVVRSCSFSDLAFSILSLLMFLNCISCYEEFLF